MLGESLCTALGWSTIVIVRALFFSPNKSFLPIKNEKSSSSFSTLFHAASEKGMALGWWEQNVTVLLRMPGQLVGRRLRLPGAVAGCRQNIQGSEKTKCSRAGSMASPQSLLMLMGCSISKHCENRTVQHGCRGAEQQEGSLYRYLQVQWSRAGGGHTTETKGDKRR